MTTLRAVGFDLGYSRYDPAGVLQAWLTLAGCSQGFVIEKNDAGESSSCVGVAPTEVLRVIGGKARLETARGARTLPGNAFAAIGRRLSELKVVGRAPSFSTGAVGFLSYEMARHLERLQLKTEREEACLMLFPAMLFADRRRRRCELVALIPQGRGAPAARRRATALAARLAALLPRFPMDHEVRREPLSRHLGVFTGAMGRRAFLRGVGRLKEHIRAGDIFQGVLSERFSAPLRAEPLAVYRALRALGPSPYLFCLRDGEKHVLGASPERLVKVVGGKALNCPIAGTRPRGATPAADVRLERALKASPKERAEHLMLVDLARNDLGRVCAPGTVRVKEMMRVHRYPNVMHLVSQVEGRLERGRSAWDALAASFPAGTVSGAPKVRAMELISELERRPRGFYAGAVLQHDLRGDLDSCIAIRSALIERGRIVIQAGAGIVADSRPRAEYQEAVDKLAGLRAAAAAAEADA